MRRPRRARQGLVDVLQGTLDLLILKALSLAPMHGWGITSRIQRMSRDAFQIGQGSRYLALHRCEHRGWVTSYAREECILCAGPRRRGRLDRDACRLYYHEDLPTRRSARMCRNIKTLANFAPPATDDEIRASALQFVRKLSGPARPSQANAAVFNRAVDEVTAAAHHLIHSLQTSAPPRAREAERRKAHERALKRFGPRTPGWGVGRPRRRHGARNISGRISHSPSHPGQCSACRRMKATAVSIASSRDLSS